MSVTVNIVQLFNPPVARNTICFMTSAVNAAFAILFKTTVFKLQLLTQI